MCAIIFFYNCSNHSAIESKIYPLPQPLEVHLFLREPAGRGITITEITLVPYYTDQMAHKKKLILSSSLSKKKKVIKLLLFPPDASIATPSPLLRRDAPPHPGLSARPSPRLRSPRLARRAAPSAARPAPRPASTRAEEQGPGRVLRLRRRVVRALRGVLRQLQGVPRGGGHLQAVPRLQRERARAVSSLLPVKNLRAGLLFCRIDEECLSF